MKDRIKACFDGVRADEELKANTLAAIAERTSKPVKKARRMYRCALAAACLVLLLTGAVWLYFSPTAQISIDINPSIELSVNRFDRVIAVAGYNQEGKALAQTLDLTFQNYEDAVAQLLADQGVAALLADDAVVTLTVVGQDKAQTDKMLTELQACTKGRQNAYCYRADPEAVQDAHACGLSYGKYRAYLELSALDPSITPQQIQGMTMRQIRQLLSALSDGEAGTQGGHGHQ